MTITTSLVKLKAAQSAVLEAAYVAHMAGDFSSAATGSTKWYASDLEGQVNIIGATVAGVDVPFRCGDNQGGTKEFLTHTPAQMQGVFSDGLNYKVAAIQNLETKLAAVDAATDEAGVLAVVW